MPRVNTLLIGSDAGKDRWGTRTDSMMVVSTNTKTGDTLLIGIPRNLERVPFPESNPLHALYPNGYDCGDQCLMNGIWTLAEGRPDLFPGVKNPGRQSTVDVVGEITGLDINQSVVINLRGFRALVDAMGGVDVNVQQRVCVECHTSSSGGIAFTTDKREYIEPGLQHLDGKHALWYARSRAGSDDFSRMRRQRCVAGALMQQADPVGLLQSYPQLAKVVKNNVSIDIPRDELSAWVDLALRIQKGGSIRSLPLTADVVRPGNPDFAKIRALVKKGLQAAGRGPEHVGLAHPRSPRPRRSRAATPTPDRHARRLPGRVARRHLLTRSAARVRSRAAGHGMPCAPRLRVTCTRRVRALVCGGRRRARGPAGGGRHPASSRPDSRVERNRLNFGRVAPEGARTHRPSLEESPAWS